jgi:DNA-binding transcriptional regulator GbsR (MarR family)
MNTEAIRKPQKNEKEQTTRPRRKCEKMENEKKTGYIVYDFMGDKMGLNGVALQVYALIYSFTKSGSACHGSISYIADRTKSSTASVQRALNFLVEEGYVSKKKISPKRPSVYTANFDSINQNDSIINESINHDDSMIQSKCEYDTIKMIDNNKDNNKYYK